MRRPFARLAVVALALWATPALAEAPARLGLFTTLPLYWGEAHEIGELLGPETAPHWARATLERDYALVPLDVLGGEADSLAGLDYLVLAQPRLLGPSENVALDAWVRGGGRLLLFADPMLTGHSIFALGDRRRPQDVALLSPILAHWGLELRFDEDQAPGERTVALDGALLPVDLAGSFAPLGEGACEVRLGGLVAECAIGQGRATIVADAALFEGEASPEREAAFAALLRSAFRPI